MLYVCNSLQRAQKSNVYLIHMHKTDRIEEFDLSKYDHIKSIFSRDITTIIYSNIFHNKKLLSIDTVCA